MKIVYLLTPYKLIYLFFILAPADFQSINAQLRFTSGQTTGGIQCTNLQVFDDSILESAETLILHLIADDTTVVVIPTGTESAVVTIGEDAVDGIRIEKYTTSLLLCH